MPFRNLLIIAAAGVMSIACYGKIQHNRYATELANTMELVQRNYVNEVDMADLFENAMDGMLGGLDQYSAYISAADFQQFQEGLDQEFGGVGIVVEQDPESEQLTVLSPLVGTPAYEAGMCAGDTILSINGISTKGMDLRESVRLMRGKPGSSVRLAVQHSGQDEIIEMDIKRAIIEIESVMGDTRRPDGSWNFVLEENPRIGYIRLTTFGERTADELETALSSIESQADALILDLRGNAGGLLDSAVSVCDMFIKEGRIVSTRGRDGVLVRKFDASARVAFDPQIPVVVLTNRYSASASEIVAGCLQDHGRAKIVGQRTWGKGTVQNIIEVEGGESAVKLTTAAYWRPSERNIHRKEDEWADDSNGEWGVRPDKGLEVIVSADDELKIVETRRNRDIVRNQSVDLAAADPVGEADGTAGESDSAAADGEVVDADPATKPFEDPQLRRAIEYLQQGIDRELAAAAVQ